MAGAERTTKKRAQRIDLNYFKRPHPFRRWRFWLSVAVPLACCCVDRVARRAR